MTLYLTEEDVAYVADMPMALSAIDAAHRAHALGEVIDIPRQRVRLPGAMQHVLQAAWPARGVMGFKAYTSSAQGARFWVHLFDARNGEPLAMIEANRLGMLRTGAVAGVASRQLAREDAVSVGLIGAGWQAQGQVLALVKVREGLQFKVYARQTENVAQFCRWVSEQTGCVATPAAAACDVVRGADIVTTVTTSPKPVLEGAWLAPGVHINAVGSNALVRRELDEKAVSCANVVCVDSREVAQRESGDLFPALEKGRLALAQLVELGEVLCGMKPGRRKADDITLFESQGMGVQDIALAAEILDRARSAGRGLALPY